MANTQEHQEQFTGQTAPKENSMLLWLTVIQLKSNSLDIHNLLGDKALLHSSSLIYDGAFGSYYSIATLTYQCSCIFVADHFFISSCQFQSILLSWQNWPFCRSHVQRLKGWCEERLGRVPQPQHNLDN